MPVGESVMVTATLENTGTAAGEYEAKLHRSAEVVAPKRVTVAAGDSATVSFDVAIEAASAVEFAVGDATATVRGVAASTPTPRSRRIRRRR